MSLGAFGLILIFMLGAGMNSKATFQSLIAALVVIDYPTRFVTNAGVTDYGWALLVFWLASILLTHMRGS